MNIQTKIAVAVLILLAVGMIFMLVRKKKIGLRYALPWVFMAGVILILDIFPEVISILAEIFGISVPVNMLFFCGFCLLLWIVFKQTAHISVLSEKVKKLTQEIALLKREMEDEQK